MISGDWNDDDLLVTSSEDKLITVSDKNGKTIKSNQIPVKTALKDIKWTNVKDESSDIPKFTSIVNNRSICFASVNAA